MAREVEVSILDYGVGNLMSAEKGLQSAGAKVRLTKKVAEALEADALVLPGVGAFKPAMDILAPHEGAVRKFIADRKYIFGICLGMELLFQESTEGGNFKGLGYLDGKVDRLPAKVKIPHMGWNTVTVGTRHPVLRGVRNGEYFYFVHSYYAKNIRKRSMLAYTDYGVKVPAIIAKDNLIGTQFHPEKSGVAGLRLLKNFVQQVREKQDHVT